LKHNSFYDYIWSSIHISLGIFNTYICCSFSYILSCLLIFSVSHKLIFALHYASPFPETCLRRFKLSPSAFPPAVQHRRKYRLELRRRRKQRLQRKNSSSRVSDCRYFIRFNVFLLFHWCLKELKILFTHHRYAKLSWIKQSELHV
jgi:hypothetical protein